MDSAPKRSDKDSIVTSGWKLQVRLGGVYLGCILAGGVLPVWPVVQPYFKEAGVFANGCSTGARVDASVAPTTSESAWRSTADACEHQDMMLSSAYMYGITALLASAWPSGMAFDRIGPKRFTAFGCLLCSVGAVGLVTAVADPEGSSWLLYPGAILTDLGSMINSFALFGFLWHYHEKKGFLVGLASSTNAGCTLVPLILLKCLPFETSLWVYAGLALIALVICLLAVPSGEEYRCKAEELLGDTLPWQDFSISESLRNSRRVFCLYYLENSLFSISLLLMICNWQYTTGVSNPFLTALLRSSEKADDVNWLGSSLYGVIGISLSPLTGTMSDVLGMKSLIFVMTALNILMTLLFAVPVESVQMIATFVGSLQGVLQGTYYSCWFTIYASPTQFGNFQGSIISLCGFAAFIIQFLLSGFSRIEFSGLLQFLVPLGLLGISNIVASVVFCKCMWDTPLPALPPILPDEAFRAGEVELVVIQRQGLEASDRTKSPHI